MLYFLTYMVPRQNIEIMLRILDIKFIVFFILNDIDIDLRVKFIMSLNRS